VKLGVRRVVLHPRYNPTILDFDVALLELARPLVFDKYIQPICLPLAIQKFPVGRKCVISGWGNMQEGNGEKGDWGPVSGFILQGLGVGVGMGGRPPLPGPYVGWTAQGPLCPVIFAFGSLPRSHSLHIITHVAPHLFV
jgi:hypothetical protein